MKLSDGIDALIVATKADNRSARTVDGYRKNLIYFLDFLGDVDLASVTITDLRRYSVYLQEREQRYVGHPVSAPQDGPLATASVACYLRSVRRLFNWLHDEGIIPTNPAEKLKVPSGKRTEPKAASMDILEAMLEATSGSEPMQLRDRAILLFLADTGCRAGGVSRLRLQDVDLQRREAKITEKGQKFRIVPFSSATRDALDNWLAVRPHVSEDWLFVTVRNCGSERLTEDGLGEMLRRLKRRAGVNGYANPHAFRHAFAREWLHNGGDLSTLSRVMGHSDPSVTLRNYAVFSSNEIRESHQRFSPIARINSQGSPTVAPSAPST